MKSQKGQTAVEFILILPFIILVFFAVFQFGMLAVANKLLEYGSFMAARSGKVYLARESSTGAVSETATVNKILSNSFVEYAEGNVLNAAYFLRPIVGTGILGRSYMISTANNVIPAPYYRCSYVHGETEDIHLHNPIMGTASWEAAEDRLCTGTD